MRKWSCFRLITYWEVLYFRVLLNDFYKSNHRFANPVLCCESPITAVLTSPPIPKLCSSQVGQDNEGSIIGRHFIVFSENHGYIKLTVHYLWLHCLGKIWRNDSSVLSEAELPSLINRAGITSEVQDRQWVCESVEMSLVVHTWI